MEIKLYNGDCLVEMDKVPDGSVDLIVTDPPYFVIPNGKNNDKFDWDCFNSEEDFEKFTKRWFELAYEKLKNDSFMFIFWSQKRLKTGFEIFNPDRLCLWHYDNLVMGGNGDFAYDYEPIFVVKKGNPKIIKGKHSCIFNYTKPQSNFKEEPLLHPTQKSKALIHKIIELASDENEIVLDLFMGSGTTGVACMDARRDFIGIEKDENYFNIAEERINSQIKKNKDKLF